MKKQILQKIILTTAIAAMGLVAFAQTTNYGTIPTGTYTDPQVVRYNASGITYTVANTEGSKASFTFKVTGGTITSAPSGTIAAGTTATFTDIPQNTPVSITVQWSNASLTTANKGEIDVTKTVDFGSGNCENVGTQVANIESWTLPLVKFHDPTAFKVCSEATMPSVQLDFEGNGGGNTGYQYKWKVVSSDGITLKEDHTSDFTSLKSASTTTITPQPIKNETGASVNYKLVITDMQDAFSDVTAAKDASGNVVSMDFTVYPVPTVGAVKSIPVLTERP